MRAFSFSRRRGRPLRLTELHVDDRSSTHLSVDDVLSLLPGGTPCYTKVGVCMRLVQLENTARGGGCYRARAAYPYRDVIPFGVTGMSVKATECTGEDEGMKFVPLVEKKQVCRHVGHSTGATRYTLERAFHFRCRSRLSSSSATVSASLLIISACNNRPPTRTAASQPSSVIARWLRASCSARARSAAILADSPEVRRSSLPAMSRNRPRTDSAVTEGIVIRTLYALSVRPAHIFTLAPEPA